MFIAALAFTIAVDQAGYPADAPKIAIVEQANVAQTLLSVQTFSVTRDGAVVLKGNLSGNDVRHADFSTVREPGTYELVVGDARATVHIASDPYADVLAKTVRAYYGQRCGIAVDEGNGYRHAACHLKTGFHPSSGRSQGNGPTGGWHDAGDYGRYVVNSGITTGTLLWTWELYRDSLPPDFLDEVRWNLEWMLAMQDADGGVWHKQTSLDFAGFVAPEDDPTTQYVIGKGSCATGDFAAVTAIAARVYDGEFAQRALAASRRAWTWLAAHPNVTYRNPRDVLTGEYGDKRCSDERLWAAAELWRTSGDRDARAYFEKHWKESLTFRDAPPSWQGVGALAAWTYALAPNGDANIAAQIRKRSVETADAIVARASRHTYRIPMRTVDYVWGSNAVAANYGLQLLIANRFSPQRAYVDTTLDILHYLLGRNAFSLSWVTGVGDHAVMHPHHRPSAADGIAAPWPGLLAGGPNRHRQDPVMKSWKTNIPAELMYVDDQESYATNEVAINWNAPLVFILAGVR